MKARLPGFSGLVAFYAAVRHGTLTGAARELNVSQPAISRRIAALEEDLGCNLFDRSHKPVQMTQYGRELAECLRGSFGEIETVVDRLRGANEKGIVTVSAPSGLVGYWLIPHLGELRDAFPELSIRIISQEYGEAERPGDIIVRFGLPDERRAGDERILGQTVFPVASPLYLQRHGVPADQVAFSDLTLLTMQNVQRNWYDWDNWFQAAGIARPSKGRRLDFNSYAMLVNAALAGQGVCLCWSGLLGDFLDSGAMLRVGSAEATSERGYYLSMREGLAARPEVQAVWSWLREAGEMDL